jgi:ESS family glutamate:Na+ symporter
MTFDFNNLLTLILSILVLYLGYFVKNRVNFFSKYSIPVSVVGGFLCSIFILLLHLVFSFKINFDLELRNLLLLVFFSTIGLNARFSELAHGGKSLLILVFACTVCLVFQNVIGITVVSLLGKDPLYGLFGGSISLAGGHGTAIAWGEMLADNGLDGLSELGIASATFGLILGGAFGGPLAMYLIEKYQLRPSEEGAKNNGKPIKKPVKKAAKKVAENEQVVEAKPVKHKVSIENVIDTIFALAICIFFGALANQFLFDNNIRLPGFLTSMFIGIIIANVTDIAKMNINKSGLDLAGGVCLQLFLSMSLMSMNLMSIANSAVLLICIIVCQLAFTIIFAGFVVFRLMGKNYDAAIISGGFFGLSLGATPVAIASMDASSKKYGPSPKAFLVIPLIGAFFIDLSNAGIIDIFLRLPFFQ